MLSGSLDDLAGLPELDDKSLLREIQTRYKTDQIYTYIGDILIAVNPYRNLPIYGPENWREYREVKLRSELPPHLYAISDCAYQSMKRNGVNQCCVVSGESGAGKTESTKLMIEHIVQLCHQNSNNLHSRIVQVNPLLEAFGNAQTVINDNSSRFGKFIELNFDQSGSILGASISEYLLEKSRVVAHSEGERTFHIFYYLFAGLDNESKEANLLSNPVDHRIMKQFQNETIFEDKSTEQLCKNKWLELMDIMVSVGFIELEVEGILAVLAAILHIADIRFTSDPDSDGVLIENENVLSLISQLLSVRAEELVKALISNTSSVGTEKVISLKNESQANDGRDALAKALYGRLFSWIVSKINMMLQPKSNDLASGLTIGILDIYGFENFKNNSFEQLCINVANEQLQYFFNLHIFKLELEEYEREGVHGSSVTFVDNRPLLELFMDKLGLFALLDEESKFPQGTDQSLIDKLAKNLDKKPEFKMPKGQGLQFMIQHFAGQVTYNVTGFLEKNRDTLSDSIMRCLKTSTSILVTEIFNLFQDMNKNGTVARNLRMSVLVSGPLTLQQINSSQVKKEINSTIQRSSKATDLSPQITKTLASHFKNSLDGLLQKLLSAQPHFIRCIKPNAFKEANNFEPELVLQQLSYTGVLETVKIRKQGYSSRIPFADFIKRYGLLLSVANSTAADTSAKSCQRLLEKSGLKEWQIGKTKVFLKYWHVEELNMMLVETSKRIVDCQKFWRSALARLQRYRLEEKSKEFSEEWKLFHQTVSGISRTGFIAQQQLCFSDSNTYCISGKETLSPSVQRMLGAAPDSLYDPIMRTSRPEGFESTRPKTTNTIIQCLLNETLDKFVTLSTDIWAKLYYMEKNAIIGKVYVREREVAVDDSADVYDGVTIGINSPGFDHLDDTESVEIARYIGKGVKVLHDDEGNIYITKLTSCDVLVKGLHNPDRFCFSQEIWDSKGKILGEVKVFDMSVFKKRLASELSKPDWDPYYLASLSVINFSFSKDYIKDTETPCWVCIINFSALDLLGKTEVLDEFRKSGQISNLNSDVVKRWKTLDFQRKGEGYGRQSFSNIDS